MFDILTKDPCNLSNLCCKMKLLTHNMLTSNIIKGVTKGYPLKIEVL